MPILVAELVDGAKALSDKRGDGSVTDPDWVKYVNWAQRSLDRKIAKLDPGFRFATTDFTLTATPTGAQKDLKAATWTPVTRFVALHGLDRSPDATLRRTIRRKGFRARNESSGLDRWWSPTTYADGIWYDLRAKTLVVTPYEAAAGAYRAYCRGGCYLFTAIGDTTPLDDQLEDYDEWIVIMAARKGLGIEETDEGPWIDRLKELNTEIQDEHSRDDGEAPVLQDVEGDDPSYIDGY